ncbi:MAG: hypothetical protein GY708_19800 [Actinomycetia bacterium]|nr:hypothetical protein [Actinomycetes bacterium]MCP4958294.1 hypothetical protein [Actinomycetes bacterium]
MDLRDLRLSLRRNWVAAIIAFDICIILGVVAAFLPASTYKTSATLSVQPQVLEGSAELTKLTTFIVPIVVEKAESRVLRSELRESLAESGATDVAGLKVSIDADAVASILYIRVSSESAVGSQVWANEIGAAIIADEDVAELVNIKMIDPAGLPGMAASPKPIPIMIAATVLGLIAALFAAVLVGRIREAFDNAELIRQRLGTSVIGELPRLRQLRRNDSALLDVLEEGTTSLSEAFKSLRGSLEFRIATEQPRAIAVSSYQMGEGKSSVAAGVSWALASVGHSVIAIDADLRRPALHHRLASTMGRGLADLGSNDLSQLLRPTSARGLQLLPAGLPDRSPADVVAVNLPIAIEAARERADVVVIDAPPLEMVAETRQVISHAGHVILVVDAASVNLPELAAAVAELREHGATLLGVVINRVRRRWWSRSYNYYSYNTSGPTAIN